ncbi:hypothetical protein [Paenarthrobacter sp. A20]|uniref:hypothetical protein n=1 Tax=Paenarthrobacter sp. A20 TaxID=2817891 RepID=UPI0020A02DC5|nr:hypothetical protein [Paenarthrobacter sp. A20]MCP1412896.1 hypothetical protein [Paenarthrobacter sp. A20]
MFQRSTKAAYPKRFLTSRNAYFALYAAALCDWTEGTTAEGALSANRLTDAYPELVNAREEAGRRQGECMAPRRGRRPLIFEVFGT